MSKIQPYEKTSQRISLHRIISNNFIGGVAWAVGVSIGFSLLIGLLTLFSHYINFVPFIGKFVSEIIDFVLSNNQSLH
jgi:hypothetical protein